MLARREEFGAFGRDDASTKQFTSLVLACLDEALFEIGGYGYQLEYFLDDEPQSQRAIASDLDIDETYEPMDMPPERQREAKVLNLTVGELSRVVSIARLAAEKHSDDRLAPHIALFLASTLARCKWFWANGREATEIPRAAGETYAKYASPVPGEFDFDALMALSGVLREYTPVENMNGAWYVATYVVENFDFDNESPKKPLYIKTGPPTEFSRRWQSLQEAAAGRDGRSVPKPVSRPPRSAL